jgi:hypothetical protein
MVISSRSASRRSELGWLGLVERCRLAHCLCGLARGVQKPACERGRDAPSERGIQALHLADVDVDCRAQSAQNEQRDHNPEKCGARRADRRAKTNNLDEQNRRDYEWPDGDRVRVRTVLAMRPNPMTQLRSA